MYLYITYAYLTWRESGERIQCDQRLSSQCHCQCPRKMNVDHAFIERRKTYPDIKQVSRVVNIIDVRYYKHFFESRSSLPQSETTILHLTKNIINSRSHSRITINLYRL